MNAAFADPTLLLVEPSAMQAKYITQCCKELGIERVRLAESATDALASMRDVRPDVVISALYLPDMTGTELVVTMRDNWPMRTGRPAGLKAASDRHMAMRWSS